MNRGTMIRSSVPRWATAAMAAVAGAVRPRRRRSRLGRGQLARRAVRIAPRCLLPGRRTASAVNRRPTPLFGGCFLLGWSFDSSPSDPAGPDRFWNFESDYDWITGSAIGTLAGSEDRFYGHWRHHHYCESAANRRRYVGAHHGISAGDSDGCCAEQSAPCATLFVRCAPRGDHPGGHAAGSDDRLRVLRSVPRD